ADIFNVFAQATGDTSYRKRAENITRNNLCNIFEDGRASCAYIYPYKVNGVKAQFYDPFANDQESALVRYLMVNGY
ncbi:MAG: six-hairpin glycosidase, partial [Dysgonamonadaceae bacterium]|nr:six-hairpin glycosidase [Dysgonamonadaceae bacterium]